MRHSLELAGLEVEVIGSMPFPFAFWLERLAHVTAERLGRARRHIWTFEPRVIREYTREIQRRLAHSSADVIFSSGSMLVSQLETSRPVYFWSDAVFASMVDYYFPRDKITPETLANGDAAERAAVTRATACFLRLRLGAHERHSRLPGRPGARARCAPRRQPADRAGAGGGRALDCPRAPRARAGSSSLGWTGRARAAPRRWRWRSC
ncbi:MAG: hypothetical protein WDO13_16005 [Verrucomicrobiota bacterium]